MKEIIGIIIERRLDPETKHLSHKKLVVLRDTNTLLYEELDVSDKLHLTNKELIKEVKATFKAGGKKVEVARHLKYLEESE